MIAYGPRTYQLLGVAELFSSIPSLTLFLTVRICVVIRI